MQRMIKILPTLVVVILMIGWASAQDTPLGPLPLLENAHAVLEPFTPVSENGYFVDDPTPIMVNGRQLEVPPNWSYSGYPGVGMLPPYIARWAGPGYRFDYSWINGIAGFAQDGIQLYGNQRYVLKAEYTTELKYLTSLPFVASDVQFYARIYTAQGGMIELPRFNMQGLNQQHEVEWVIESTANPYPFIRLEALFEVKHPTFVGKVFMQKVEIQTAPPEYKPDFVIYFE